MIRYKKENDCKKESNKQTNKQTKAIQKKGKMII